METTKDFVPDYDNTMYWCDECEDYRQFKIYDKSYDPHRCVCQSCNTGFRLSYLSLVEKEHPAVQKN